MSRLFDKLSDEEKKRIIFLYEEADLFAGDIKVEDIDPISHYSGRKVCLEMVFGKDVFDRDLFDRKHNQYIKDNFL